MQDNFMPLDQPILDSHIRCHVSLAPLTSMRVGGQAEYFISPHNTEELAESLAWANSNNIDVTVIGAGSNLLISDAGIKGLVICTRHLRNIQFGDDGLITAAAGEPIARLAMQAASHGWTGLEWAVGIPGTVGGLVVMNAGAQGGCAADCIRQVRAVHRSGKVELFDPKDLHFSYRTSVLQGSDYLVTEAVIQLHTGADPKQILADTETKLKARHTTQPYNLPNCGSVFRNPLPHFAAKLIQEAGLKGYRIGNAQVSELHANFIVNLGNASATDIFQLIQLIQSTIRDRYSILLETEVKMIGNF
ncbi:MAG: UDP-N-acetylmuramate dehydrogenase [Pseudanabaenaceae cyanobacterium bins.39]|nr:UDP-N-acetylmuramate dehydrogenase [Pseudanabaenaceae cyanobacterium bins.39]